MIKWEKDLIEKLKSKTSEVRLTMLLEEANTKYKVESKMQEIYLIENLKKEPKFNKLLKSFNKDLLALAPNTFQKAKIDKLAHLETGTTFKTEEPSDQMTTMSKTIEEEALILNKEMQDKEDNKWDKKIDQEERKSNKKNNILNPKTTDKRGKKWEEITICKIHLTMIIDNNMLSMKDNRNKEIAHLHSETIDKEVNQEARRVLSLHLEGFLLNYAVTFN